MSDIYYDSCCECQGTTWRIIFVQLITSDAMDYYQCMHDSGNDWTLCPGYPSSENASNVSTLATAAYSIASAASFAAPPVPWGTPYAPVYPRIDFRMVGYWPHLNSGTGLWQYDWFSLNPADVAGLGGGGWNVGIYYNQPYAGITAFANSTEFITGVGTDPRHPTHASVTAAILQIDGYSKICVSERRGDSSGVVNSVASCGATTISGPTTFGGATYWVPPGWHTSTLPLGAYYAEIPWVVCAPGVTGVTCCQDCSCLP